MKKGDLKTAWRGEGLMRKESCAAQSIVAMWMTTHSSVCQNPSLSFMKMSHWNLPGTLSLGFSPTAWENLSFSLSQCLCDFLFTSFCHALCYLTAIQPPFYSMRYTDCVHLRQCEKDFVCISWEQHLFHRGLLTIEPPLQWLTQPLSY